jgi:hypothetical protein
MESVLAVQIKKKEEPLFRCSRFSFQQIEKCERIHRASGS